VKRFLVVAPQGLGDSLEATPLVRALRRFDPACEIDVAVTRQGPRLLFSGLEGYVNDVHYLPYWEKGRRAFAWSLIRSRIGKRYDAAFLAFPSARPLYHALLTAFSATSRYAHDWEHRIPIAASNRIRLVPVRSAHNVERNRDLLRAAGIPADGDEGYLVPASWVRPPEERVSNGIAIHVGSVSHDGLAAKRWPLENFARVCEDRIAHGAEVTLIVGDDERAECERLLAEIPGLTSYEGSLPDVARFLSTRALVVANDSGIGHLAAGVGTPVISLFGPTPVEFAPFSSRARVLRPSGCPPCFDVRRPVVECVREIDFACLKRDLTVSRVLEEIDDVFSMATPRGQVREGTWAIP